VLKNLASLLVDGGRFCIEVGGSGRNLPLSWIWQDASYNNGLGLFSEIVIPHRKTNPTAWGSWLKADNVYTIPNFHMLYVFYKESATKKNGDTEIAKKDFVEWTRGHWNINYTIGKVKGHPASFPVEIPFRCMGLFGHKDDIILDIFLGSGTTGLTCERLNRRWIGIEIEEKYCEISAKRIEKERSQLKLF